MSLDAAPLVPITGPALAERAAAVRDEVGKAFIGQAEVLDQILIALLAGGHALLEGVPGLGKTLVVRALSKALDCGYARVQFTPDLMPSDISGHAVYDPKTESFNIRRGPVFTNLLLADEINRAPAKTQSALLEAMQELQVTIEGHSFELPPPFLTLATQNPVEQEGTYPLPEAQLDRFLLKVLIGYPTLADEKRMVGAVSLGRSASDFDLSQVQRVLGPEEIVAMQLGTALVQVDEAVIDYAVRIVAKTRAAASAWCARRARRRCCRAATSSPPTTCARSPSRCCAIASRWRRNCRSKASPPTTCCTRCWPRSIVFVYF